MAEPEWGSKHVCLNCAAKFYDMNRVPAICPACGSKGKESNSPTNQGRAPTKPREPNPAQTVDGGSEVEDDNDTQILEDTNNTEEGENGIAELLEGGLAQED